LCCFHKKKRASESKISESYLFPRQALLHP